MTDAEINRATQPPRRETPIEPGEPFIHEGPGNIPLPCVDAELHKRWQDYARQLKAELAAARAALNDFVAYGRSPGILEKHATAIEKARHE